MTSKKNNRFRTLMNPKQDRVVAEGLEASFIPEATGKIQTKATRKRLVLDDFSKNIVACGSGSYGEAHFMVVFLYR
ncbi:MAG TPA: hypothetical protein PLL64_02630 [Rhodothermales bacterium]|nr:hypothetical protein [Rhodothermales bacterium]